MDNSSDFFSKNISTGRNILVSISIHLLPPGKMKESYSFLHGCTELFVSEKQFAIFI